MSKFIVIGWDSENGDGKDYIGPFDTYGDAEDYAVIQCGGGEWEVVKLWNEWEEE